MCWSDLGGFEGNAGALLLVAGVLCVVQTSALAAECRVVALGDGVAVVVGCEGGAVVADESCCYFFGGDVGGLG